MSGVLHSYTNNNGSFEKTTFSEDHSRLEIGTVGDINADGRVDMIFGGNPFFETKLVIYENDGFVSTNEILPFNYEINPSLVVDDIILNTDQDVICRILDINGHIVKSAKISGEHRISAKDIQAGFYFVQLTKDKNSVTKKILITGR